MVSMKVSGHFSGAWKIDTHTQINTNSSSFKKLTSLFYHSNNIGSIFKN